LFRNLSGRRLFDTNDDVQRRLPPNGWQSGRGKGQHAWNALVPAQRLSLIVILSANECQCCQGTPFFTLANRQGIIDYPSGAAVPSERYSLSRLYKGKPVLATTSASTRPISSAYCL